MCYAALIQTDNFIVPYRIAVDSYVLAELNPNTNEAGDIYYELDSEQIQVLQQEQQLPNPTPTYEIGMDTYLPALGLIALVVAWLVWQIKAIKTVAQNNQRPVSNVTTPENWNQHLDSADQGDDNNSLHSSSRCDNADNESSSEPSFESSSDDSCSSD